MKLHDYDRRGVLGVSGAGKTHYVMNRIVKPAQRVLVWDLCGEYAAACDLDEVEIEEFLVEPQLMGAARCRLAVVTEWDNQVELAKWFNRFFSEVKAYGQATGDDPSQPSMTLVIEETSLLRPHADGVLVALATQSRKWKMPLVLVSQRATMQPPGVRSQWSQLVSFRQNEPGDIDALEERIGAEKAQQVMRLPRRRMVTWTEEDVFRVAKGDATTGAPPQEERKE